MNNETTITVLSAKDIAQALPITDAIDAMRTAFTQLAQHKTKMPIRAHIDIPEKSGTALFMPSYAQGIDSICIKTVTLFENNPQNNLPLIQGMVCLFDASNGSPLAILDAASLTALRTGAASGLATDLLAREESSAVAIFGAGIQARTQLRAVCAVRPIVSAAVYDPNPTAAQTFASEMASALNIEITPADSPKQALKSADIVCTATVSSTPVFDDAHLPDGIHINAVGSYKPHVQEIPAKTVQRAKVVVDHKQSALAETGDLIIPINDNLITPAHIHAQLGDILTGKSTARTTPHEITFFKSVGLAIQDLAAATKALNNAKQKKLGQRINL